MNCNCSDKKQRYIPSPAHKLQITAIETGDVLQKTIVVRVIAQA
jgi:hypothetical protein